MDSPHFLAVDWNRGELVSVPAGGPGSQVPTPLGPVEGSGQFG